MHISFKLPACFSFSLFLIISLITSSCGQPQLVETESDQTTPSPPLIDHDYSAHDHSGMWLLSQLQGNVYNSMNSLGLSISTDSIYHAENPSLNEAIVRINIGEGGGGTGSFVSKNGLILTNHHIAYDGIVAASSGQHNYLEDGFYADRGEKEIAIPNYSLYIPIEELEVTQMIDGMLAEDLSNQQRVAQKAQIEQAIIDEWHNEDPNLVVEIDEYWSGNRQFMTVYKIIRDVRLVYAPKRSVGKFGGDIDNWMWPRHTGDFTFLRAYVSSDGSSDSYHPKNTPFTPDFVLPFRKAELQPQDFTMILGFPGTTHRFESSYAFQFYHDQQIPVLQKVFSVYLNSLERGAKIDSQYEIQNASEIASIRNALKYYDGVQQGFDKHDVISKKRSKDREFNRWAKADSIRNLTYGRVIQQLDQSYRIAGQMGDLLYLTFYSLEFSNLLQMSTIFDEYADYYGAEDREKYPEDERRLLYDQNRAWIDSFNEEAEAVLLADLLKIMAELPEGRRPLILYQFFDSEETESLHKEIDQFIDRQLSTSALLDTTSAREWIFTETYDQPADSLYLISSEIRELFEISRDNYIQHFQYLIPAQQRYEQGMMEMNNEEGRYPDANFTLRLTGGLIDGYSPANGVYNTPFTTFSGMLEKQTGEEPFDLPRDLYNYSNHSGNFGGYGNKSGDLIVNFLSTNDITGGNSGSPVLNGSGELIGLAFDGNIEGIIGDYFHVPELSRTISVDSRFILFMMDQIDNTERLLDEIEVLIDY